MQASQRAADVRAELEQLQAVERELTPQVGDGIAPDTAEWHRRMAELLRERGLVVPAKGHALRAEALEK